MWVVVWACTAGIAVVQLSGDQFTVKLDVCALQQVSRLNGASDINYGMLPVIPVGLAIHAAHRWSGSKLTL